MKSTIKRLATQLELKVNETYPNVVCPFCNDKEKSFSLTRTPVGLLYNCFRAKCGAKGFVPLLPHEISAVPDKREFTPKIFNLPLRNFSDEECHKYFDKYELSSTLLRENGVKYDQTNHRVVLPINNIDGYRWGYVAKKLQGSEYSGPKAVAYFEQQRPKLAYPKYIDSVPGWVAVVEDILSAIKVSQIVESVALMGTSLNDDAAAELASRYHKLIILLDPGAEQQAIKIANKYRLYFNDVKICLLSADPKDTPYKELKGVIHGTINPGRNVSGATSV